MYLVADSYSIELETITSQDRTVLQLFAIP